MKLSLPAPDFRSYLRRQFDAAFPDNVADDLDAAISEALLRTSVCFSKVALRGYSIDGEAYLNHLHGDQMAVFLYYLSNAAHHNDDRSLAQKAMLLNKSHNGIVITYDTTLPDHMLLIHTVGTTLGKGTYGDYFVATQNVTVGSHRGEAPVFGEGVILYPGSMVAGRCKFGDRTRVAAGSVVLDMECASGSLLSGAHPGVTVKHSTRITLNDYFTPTD
ncbi:MAG: serine acetyltransferase [Candidatus Baltobacteraceae bacterium]